jgi:hypothetical protein
MNLDIRLPIGLLFATLGVLLTGYGLVSDRAIYARSLDININLFWGLALLVFGILMTFFGTRKAHGTARPGATAAEPPRRGAY